MEWQGPGWLRYLRARDGETLPTVGVFVHEEWAVALRLAELSGDAVLEELHIAPAAAVERLIEEAREGFVEDTAARVPAGLTARALRGLPVGSFVEVLRSEVEALRDEQGPSGKPALLAEGREVVLEDASPGGGDALLAWTAGWYVAMVRDSKKPVAAALARKLDISVNTLNSRLARARARGLLTSPGPGKRGGELTHRAFDVLLHDLRGEDGESETEEP